MSRLNELRKATKPIDAAPLFKMMMDNPCKSDEEREELRKRVERGFESAGELLLERAYLEKVLTPFEFSCIFTKYGLDIKDLGVVLQGYFGSKDKKLKGDKVHVLTMPDTSIYKAKKFIKERFGINVILISDLMEKCYEEDPEEFKEFAKQQNMKPDELIKKLRKEWRKEGWNQT